MKVRWIHRFLILVLTAVIVLPCEEDGTFDLAFLDVRGREVHSTLAKKIHNQSQHKTRSEIQSGIETRDLAIYTRGRYDFLDLVFSGSFELSKVEVHYFSGKFNAPKTYFSYLLSSLLLNLPPPTV
ncbi:MULTISPECIES: hypothetical protein [Leptospira]|uniref:Uncharacterized protein n=3 Tax=Leptospira kirschneri TaxID=29507 RepID=A0A0E2B114_9LEPT|nr:MULTISPECIES: hypothetical protein [Leptospira]EMO78007.1 hypothetical protein LEP1GSC127_0953 [Leptospira kirschneri str. 200801925]EJO68145.1 hypothetical protein LEP1GSC044_2458 [Leptospira kirschneri serovar Grippotyphosa str. RM52]EKO08038.1 hypothetical protein LEP1GSC077_1753 [Leptospira interrogans str. C10069]EKO14936.1 hypothetical protein LEP1GSC081_1487 [Leptospira kirschneri str. H1]EKO52973.1 hypothetical protein LEP1GSC131_2174 [Leptospira kirschneri str. 200802841]